MELGIFKKRRQRLTDDELGQLKRLTSGYGNLRDICGHMDVPTSTFRMILRRGYGEQPSISKIRAFLLNLSDYESHTHQPRPYQRG